MARGKFQPKLILGIETSCDETAAAVVLKGGGRIKLLSNIVASSAELQAKYGGVIPEQAAREQLKTIIPVIKEALRSAQCKPEDLDALAVTQGPGLIGSLLIGVETTKTLSLVWDKPLIPINHLIAHFYANWVGQSPNFPALGLLISGGHTDLILMRDHGKYDYLGGTRDDAAGEAFDKTARLLDLPYPGGPNLARLAEKGDPQAFKLPRPMIGSVDFDFSFSGLKTAVANIIERRVTRVGADEWPVPRRWLRQGEQDPQHADLAASVQQAIVDVLIKKTIRAANKYHLEQILVAGGVAANQKLREEIIKTARREIPKSKVFIPPVALCTDNAVTTAIAALFNPYPIDPLTLQAASNLSLANSPSPA